MRTKKFRWGNPLFVVFLAIAGIFGISSAVINKQAQEQPVVEKAEAAQNTYNFYVAVNTTYTVKVYYDAGHSTTGLVTLSKNGKTYHGLPVYSASIKDSGSAVNFDRVLVQLFDGGTCKEEKAIISSWSSFTHSGQVYLYGNNSWATYSADPSTTSKTLYIDASNWVSGMGSYTPQCHYWIDWGDGNQTSYSDVGGVNITSVSGGGSYSNKKWWAFSINPNGTSGLKFLFMYNGYDMQTGDITYDADKNAYYLSGTKSDAPESSFSSDGNIYKIVRYKKLGSANATTLGTDYVLGGESYQTPSLPGSVTGYNTPTKWSTNADGSGTTYTPSTDWISNITSNKTLYAYFSGKTYTVTFNKQSGTGGSNSATATFGSAMPEISLPTRNGYDFGGYFTSSGGSGTKYYNADGSSAKNWDKSTATTLHAYWTEATYTISVDLDDGSGVSDDSYTFSTSAQTVTLDAPTKSGKDFAGYSVTTQPTSGTVTVAADGLTLNIPASTYGDFEVTAQWSDGTYTISYNANGGSASAPSSQHPGVGATVTLASYSGTKTGYTFTGWNTNSGGTGSHYDAGGEYTPSIAKDGTLALFAEWTVNTHTLTWNFNSADSIGEYSPAAGTVAYGTAISKPTVSRTGYTFDGWSTDATTMPDSDLTIAASWSANTYTVSLNNQSATTAGATSVTATYDSDMPSIAANLPAKTGYTFGGYYTETGGNGTKYINANGTSAHVWDIAAATPLYAKWTINTYTITYDRNKSDGTQATQNKNYGSDVYAYTPGTAPINGSAWNPSAYHYFSHWNTEYDDSDAVINAGGTITDNTDFTLYYIEKWYDYRYTINGGSPVYMTANSSAEGALQQFAPASAQELPLHGILNFQVNRHDGVGWVNISVSYIDGSNYNTTTGIQLATNDTIFLKIHDGETYDVWVPGISERTIMISNASGNTSYTMKGNGDNECVTVGYVYAVKGDMLQAEYKGGGGYKVWLDADSTGFENTGETWGESTGVRCTESGAYTVYLKKGSGEWHNVWISRSEEASAKHFAKQFNEALSAVCTDVLSGSKDLDDIQSVWGTSSSSGLYADFVNYSTATKNYFKGATATSDSDILACIEKYNYIENKYGTTALPNFFERSDSYKPAIQGYSYFNLLGDENDLTSIIIIISSSIALVSITGLSILVLKKRKTKEE